jgi:hypothetical protein
MKVSLITTNVKLLPKKLQKYAYGQNDKGELIELKVGDTFDLYGYREYDGEVFYLVFNPDLLWWMPAQLYAPDKDDIRKKLPAHWQRVEHRLDDDNSSDAPDTIIAPDIYHENMDEIEDNTSKGQAVVEKIVKDERNYE